ncbi:MAG: TAT-variant-translocated molybdopterin oxidoreductase [Bacteroidota bacterium]
MGNKTKYWKSLGELKDNPEILQTKENEFAEQLPSDIFTNDGVNEASTSRRDFLKFVGFSMGAAALASCEAPVTKTIPYLMKPEEVTPGVANWYASTFDDGHDYCPVLVKTREGRPIKIEGNNLSKITWGGTSARVQGSVLSLYDKARYAGAVIKGAAKSWEDVDRELGTALNGAIASGKSVRVLSSTVMSPSMRSAISEFCRKTGAKHIQYDAVSQYAIRKAHWHTHDKAILPAYQFGNASVIVSFGADFLANWISPVEYAKQYSKNRKVSRENKTMSKHVQFESILSLTGSNADTRVPVKPSDLGANVVALYNELSGQSLPVSGKVNKDAIAKTAGWLRNNKGKSLVVCGVNDVAVQIVVNEINKWLGSYGTTIDADNASNYRQGNDEEFAGLVKDMNEGKVGALIMYRSNPVYTAASMKFADALKKVDVKVSLSTSPDETSALCDFVCPDHHYLESWSDSNPRSGHYSLGQPAIAPLFKTRSAMESFLRWSGNNQDAHTYITNYWMAHVFPMQGKYMKFSEFWNHSLHDGVAEVGTAPVVTEKKEETKKEVKPEEKKEETAPVMTDKWDVAAAAGKIAEVKGGAMELIIYEKTGIGSGNHSNNPWLVEFPDPISKVTWDHYITMNPADMQGKYDTLERQDMIGDIATITVNGVTSTLPVFPQPGQATGTIGIAVGYGRMGIGKVAEIAGGDNAYKYVQMSNTGTMQYFAGTVTISDKTGESFHFACTQQHHTMMGRKMVNETSIGEYINGNPEHWNHKEYLTVFNTEGGHEKVPVTTQNLWDNFDRPGHRWGLAIDLNSCIGCGACVIGCQAENNTATVGKSQIRNVRDMYWLRIDRYYSSPMTEEVAKQEGVGKVDMYLEMEKPHTENPRVVFQPVMCQHCNHAPCETVCPVVATTHGNDGLNQMTYNRCIGTRYCANNCPYKVRRFNWYNLNANYRFEHINPAHESDLLGRMVLNPDVVVRSRGVMEKCSMCIQRIQAGKLKAKLEERKLADGDVQTACAQACPTNAIIFGDLSDKNSMIAKHFADERSYFLLEDVGTLPNVAYLTKVRNVDESEMPKEEHKNKEDKKEEKKEHA